MCHAQLHQVKKNNNYKTESVQEANTITPAGPTPQQAAEGREQTHGVPEISSRQTFTEKENPHTQLHWKQPSASPDYGG